MRNHMRAAAAVLGALLLGAVAVGCSGSDSTTTSEQADAVDRAFLSQMIPHHQMAIEMAQMAEEQGDHPQVRDLAQRIIAAQRAEIGELRQIGQGLGMAPGDMAAHQSMDRMMHNDETLGVPMGQTGMSMNMSELEGADPFDQTFIDMMIPHHEGAIRMARAELANGADPRLLEIAEAIVNAQTKEIDEMNSWREQWYGAPSHEGEMQHG